MSIFDQPVNRRHSNSFKWDAMEQVYNLKDTSDILPMWVADMDFAAPQAVTQALHNHLEQAVFGYSFIHDDVKGSIADWLNTRHGWQIEKETILFRQGVIPAMANILTALTNPGDKVLVSTPVYPPFFNVPKTNDREVITCPLIEENGTFVYDFEAFEQALAQDVKMYILCNPHNPGGYVWSEATLKEIVRLCAKYDVLILSDEIHADLMLDGAVHTPLAKVAGNEIDRIITCMAPTKTFNLAGIQIAYMIATDKKKRAQLETVIAASGHGSLNNFAPIALHAAYTEGTPWLDELLVYVSKNIDYVISELGQLPGIHIQKPQGTYLIWIDYRELGIDEKDMMKRLLEVGRLALEPGSKYGVEGKGFLRMNVACSLDTVKDGVARFKQALA
ncbi:MalY/PatB family protein [Lysinibacillus sp. NPDC096418]|uniref:MalY/PatB family protein n=1 Tax=Lysinibacillus sp. NPDC096418 TaxID=3364138 RepID=UPI0037F6D5A3